VKCFVCLDDCDWQLERIYGDMGNNSTLQVWFAFESYPHYSTDRTCHQFTGQRPSFSVDAMVSQLVLSLCPTDSIVVEVLPFVQKTVPAQIKAVPPRPGRVSSTMVISQLYTEATRTGSTFKSVLAMRNLWPSVPMIVNNSNDACNRRTDVLAVVSATLSAKVE
jgi:hypothetical protein